MGFLPKKNKNKWSVRMVLTNTTYVISPVFSVITFTVLIFFFFYLFFLVKLIKANNIIINKLLSITYK